MVDSPVRRRPGRAPAGTVDGKGSLLRAARVVFAERGYAAATTREILSLAGTSSPTLHHHFGSKSGLYLAVLGEVTEEILSYFEQALEGRTAFLDRFDAIMDASVEIAVHDQAVSRIVFAAPIEARRHPELIATGARTAHFGVFIEDMCRTSTGLAVEPAVAAKAVMTIIYGLGRSAMTLGPDKYREFVDAARVLVHGQLSGR